MIRWQAGVVGIILALGVILPVFADGTRSVSPPLEIREEDGTPANLYPYQLRFANGNVTNNGDGTVSIADQSGAGGGDPVLIDGTGVTDGSGVDLQGGAGIDITFNAAVSPDTASFVTDFTEINSLTFGSGTFTTLTFDAGIIDPVWTYSSGVVNLSTGALQEGGIGVPNLDELDASSELLAIIDDETGTGVIVFGTSPIITTSLSQDGDVADAGYLRLANAALIGWEASPAAADITLTVDASEIMQASGTFNATTLTEGAVGVPNTGDNLSVFAATTSLQLLGVLSDETGPGAAVFGPSPPFTTPPPSPLVLGGTATTSDLALQTTSGVGAAGADMHFLVGNNGATEALTILNSGFVGIGTAGPLAKLDVIGDSIRFGSVGTALGTGYALEFSTTSNLPRVDFVNNGVYVGQFSSNATDVLFKNNLNNTGNIDFRTNTATVETSRLYIINNGNVGIGTTTPAGRLDLTTAATNDDVTYFFTQARVATTDATPTTLQTVAITASRTYVIESRVVARRTGGAAGTADDGAAYVIRGAYTTKSATVTLLGAVQADFTAEDQAGWNATLVISGSNVLVQVTGAVDNTVTWHVTSKISYVGT